MHFAVYCTVTVPEWQARWRCETYQKYTLFSFIAAVTQYNIIWCWSKWIESSAAPELHSFSCAMCIVWKFFLSIILLFFVLLSIHYFIHNKWFRIYMHRQSIIINTPCMIHISFDVHSIFDIFLLSFISFSFSKECIYFISYCVSVFFSSLFSVICDMRLDVLHISLHTLHILP